jgi:hypothetical protein
MTEKITCQFHSPAEGLPCRHYIRPNDPTEPGFCRLPDYFRCIEAVKRKLPALSFSSLTDFIHCKMRYKHQIDGIEVRPEHLPEAMKLGSAWDAFLNTQFNPEIKLFDKIQPLQLSDGAMAKYSALVRAFNDLEVKLDMENLLGVQWEINVPVGDTRITASVDRAYQDHIVEVKLSSRPDFYTQKENLFYQLSTYFLGDDRWEYADVQITRVPQLRTGYGKLIEESSDAYEQRCYSDILSRPAFYFIGWDRKSRTYGTRFYRSEFDLDQVFQTYVHVLHEIKSTCRRDAWYPNNLACHVPAPCIYLPIKKSGIVSDEIYIRKGGEKN